MPNTINDTKQLYSIARRVTALERKAADNDELSRKITRKTDEDIAFRRDLNDLLYNLDSDNIPMLNKVLKYQDDYATAIAEIRMEVSSQGASITQLVQFQQAVESAGYINAVQVEALISASVNEYGGTINSYLRGNYYTQTEVNNQLITTSNTITNSITQSITQSGGSINSYLSGQYYTKSQVDGNIINSQTTITNSITQSITQSGGSINSYLMGEFADQQSLATISQSVSQNTSNISLLASRMYGAESSIANLSIAVSQNSAEIALIAQTGTMTGSMIIGAINSESYAVISADRISLAGKNINLTSDNITISSSYFNVDRYGNLTATSGTFTGTINATAGNINGTLYFGGNSNFYISGSGTYRLHMYYDSLQYFRVTNAGIMEAFSATLNTLSIKHPSYTGYLLFQCNGSITEIRAMNTQVTFYASSNLTFNITGATLSMQAMTLQTTISGTTTFSSQGNFMITSYNDLSIRCGGVREIRFGNRNGYGSYQVVFEPGAEIFFNNANINY